MSPPEKPNMVRLTIPGRIWISDFIGSQLGLSSPLIRDTMLSWMGLIFAELSVYQLGSLKKIFILTLSWLKERIPIVFSIIQICKYSYHSWFSAFEVSVFISYLLIFSGFIFRLLLINGLRISLPSNALLF